jgi:hypothetical protein
MSDSGSVDDGLPVATLTVGGREGQPDLEKIKAALHTIYPESTHRIEYRAVSLGDDVQLVFEVFKG